jgi:putative aldouronate transport system substrate-binding protein
MIFCMMLALLASCTTAGSTTAAPTGTGSTTTPSGTTATQKPAVTITVALDTHPEDKVDESLPWFQELAKRCNVNLKIIPFPSDATVAAEKKNAMLSAANLPDLFAVDSAMANLYGPEGVFAALDNLLAENAPNLTALLKPEDVLPLRNMNDGNLYFIPREWELNSTTEGLMTYRKDILTKMGEQEPTTIAGWTDLLRKVKAAYPDLITLSERGRWVDAQMKSVFGCGVVYGNYGITAQGGVKKIEFLPITDNYKAMIEFYRVLYAEKILDNGYQTIDYADWWDKNVCGGKTFACFTQNFNRAYEATAIAEQLGVADVDWWVALTPANPFTNEKAIYKKLSPWLNIGLAVSAKSAVQAEAVQLCDYLYSEEGILFYHYGLEGQTYQMNNGKPERIPNNDMMAFTKVRVSLGFAFMWPTINGIETQGYYSEPIMIDHFDKNGPLCKPVANVSPVPEDVEVLTAFQTELDTYWNTMMDKFITGAEPMSQWDAFVTECKTRGADTGIQIVQKWTNAYYAKLN